jgi:hypothetical protein
MENEKIYNDDGTRDWLVLTDWEEQILLDMEDRYNKNMYGADDLVFED